MINKSFGAPSVTKDGVSVAKEIELKDNFKYRCSDCQLASKTADEAGDGTTTATSNWPTIFKEGARLSKLEQTPLIFNVVSNLEKVVRKVIRTWQPPLTAIILTWLRWLQRFRK